MYKISLNTPWTTNFIYTAKPKQLILLRQLITVFITGKLNIKTQREGKTQSFLMLNPEANVCTSGLQEVNSSICLLLYDNFPMNISRRRKLTYQNLIVILLEGKYSYWVQTIFLGKQEMALPSE
jgi:hypothetical protein